MWHSDLDLPSSVVFYGQVRDFEELIRLSPSQSFVSSIFEIRHDQVLPELVRNAHCK
jgi:hypothetical protein